MIEWNGEYHDFKNKFDTLFTPDVTAKIYFCMALACVYGVFATGEGGFIVGLFGWLAAAFSARLAGDYECVMAQMWEQIHDNPRNRAPDKPTSR